MQPLFAAKPVDLTRNLRAGETLYSVEFCSLLGILCWRQWLQIIWPVHVAFVVLWCVINSLDMLFHVVVSEILQFSAMKLLHHVLHPKPECSMPVTMQHFNKIQLFKSLDFDLPLIVSGLAWKWSVNLDFISSLGCHKLDWKVRARTHTVGDGFWLVVIVTGSIRVRGINWVHVPAQPLFHTLISMWDCGRECSISLCEQTIQAVCHQQKLIHNFTLIGHL